jgi:hypothetical protein
MRSVPAIAGQGGTSTGCRRVDSYSARGDVPKRVHSHVVRPEAAEPREWTIRSLAKGLRTREKCAVTVGWLLLPGEAVSRMERNGGCTAAAKAHEVYSMPQVRSDSKDRKGSDSSKCEARCKEDKGN